LALTKVAKISTQRLEQLEREFEPLLRRCLEECAKGRWGLFAKSEYLVWPEADQVLEMARKIRTLRAECGGENAAAAKFLALYHQRAVARDPNALGDPRLAEQLLAEMGGPGPQAV
jgi:hypothetical protein